MSFHLINWTGRTEEQEEQEQEEQEEQVPLLSGNDAPNNRSYNESMYLYTKSFIEEERIE